MATMNMIQAINSAMDVMLTRNPDVLVFGDSDEIRAGAVALVEAVGLRAIEAGPLANSAAAEALTSVLIQINRRYKAGHAGIRITGLSGDH